MAEDFFVVVGVGWMGGEMGRQGIGWNGSDLREGFRYVD